MTDSGKVSEDMSTTRKMIGGHHALLHVAQLFIYTIAADILVSETAFILGRAISWYTLPVSFLIGIMCLTIFYGDKVEKNIIYEIIISVLIFLFLTGFCGKLYDFSWDGNAYHKLAVGLLENHWNPIFQLASDASLTILKVVDGWATVWVECYAKGAWILAAGIYGVTGNIECGKAYTMIAMVCALCMTYYVMREYKKGTLFSVAFSLVATLNPVALQQMTTFYVDGYLHIMLYILVLSLSVLNSRKGEKNFQRIFGSIAACAMVICGTIKFTGLFYGGMYCIVFFLYYSYRQIKEKEAQKYHNILRCFCRFATLAVVTVLWAGADAYVMNTVRHGFPLYPLYGEGAIDIMTFNSPFGDVNHVKNLLTSLFSKMENLHYSMGMTPTLKIPFTVDWKTESIYAIHGYDTRLSGFGIFFSGILLISIFAITIKLITVCMDKEKFKQPEMQFNCLLLLTNIGLCLVITESWWARYAPYIYFVALMGIYLLWDSKREGKVKKLVVCLKVALFVLFLCNNLINLSRLPGEWRRSVSVHNNLYELSSYQKVEVDVSGFLGTYFNFEDLRVRYLPNGGLTENGFGTKLPYMGIQALVEQ